MHRRRFLSLSATFAIVAGGVSAARRALAASPYRVARTEQEWRARLTPAQYAILLQQNTETPFTSPLLNEHRAGTFACVGCDQTAFSSTRKYDSHTGWPSFWEAIKGATATATDNSEAVQRTEVHCTNCGGHLGHVFEDGPEPTGLRYCMNGAVLKFTPA